MNWLEDPVVAGWLLAAVAAAIVVVGGWLTFPRGREPALGRVALVFVGGLLSPLLMLPMFPLAALAEGLPELPLAFIRAFLLAAIPEELVKAFVVWCLVLRNRPVRRAQDGAFYGLAAGMGFALLENVMYVAGAPDGADQVAFIRVLAAAPMHAAATAMVIHGLFLARLAPPEKRRGHVVRGFVAAVALHGLYDLCLMVAMADARFVGFALGAPVVLFIGLAAAGNRFFVARRLDDALLARQKQGTGALRRGTGPLQAPRGTGPLGPLP